MATLLVSFLVFLAVIGAMAVGVMFGREPIKGSCGGINALQGGSGDCPVCGGQPQACKNREG